MKQGGFSLIEALVALALIGLVSIASVNVIRNAYDSYKMTKLRQNESAISNYYLQFVDCIKTAEDAGYKTGCNNTQPINIRASSGDIILPVNGLFFKDLFVTNYCEGGDIYLSVASGEMGRSSRPLLNGIPIICRNAGPAVVDKPIDLNIVFEAVDKKLDINLQFVTVSKSTDNNGRITVLMSPVAGSMRHEVTGSFPDDLKTQLLAGQFSAVTVFNPQNGNTPYTFTARLTIANLVVNGQNKGSQTFTMTKSGKTLNLDNNEGNINVLRTTETIKASDKCKIESTGKSLSGQLTELTLPAPCDFLMPKIRAGHTADQLGDIVTGTYWSYHWINSSVSNMCPGPWVAQNKTVCAPFLTKSTCESAKCRWYEPCAVHKDQATCNAAQYVGIKCAWSPSGATGSCGGGPPASCEAAFVWRQTDQCHRGNGLYDVAHSFPYLDGYVNPSDLAKIPRTASNPNQHISLDNGFLLAEPSGDVYLVADAGIAQKGRADYKSADKMAEIFINSLKAKCATSLYAPFCGTSFKGLRRPSPDKVFAKYSVLAIYDDTNDMFGTLNIDELTKYVVTYDIGLRWSSRQVQ